MFKKHARQPILLPRIFQKNVLGLNGTNPGPSHEISMGWDGTKFLKRGMGWDEKQKGMEWDGIFETWDGMRRSFLKRGMGWDEK